MGRTATRSETGATQPDAALVLPLDALDRGSLPLAGGKAANLGELLRAGLPVPPGFCITTTAYAHVAAGAALDPHLDALATTSADDQAALSSHAADLRAALLAAPVPPTIEAAVIEAYEALGANVAVAVRSSATAEDLPGASFAGQQETFLHVIGRAALLDATRRCWASLWTERAVSYRARGGIDPRGVRLAVVVQRMVPARVAGVLFTANPLTGKRHQAVIDASPGLGEAVVSGAVNPDHFVVDTPTGAIIERRLGDKRVAIEALPGGGTRRVDLADRADDPCLTDEELRALAALGARVEAHYGAPQDTEWALDPDGALWLTQSRPITTLFPLPTDAPAGDDKLRVYFSFNVAQGVFAPLTPLGIGAFRLIGTTVATTFGLPPKGRYVGPGIFAEAASRLFFDITPAFRDRVGRRLIRAALGQVESRSAALIAQLEADPRLGLIDSPRWRLPLGAFRVAARNGVFARIAQALILPGAARRRVRRLEMGLRDLGTVPPDATAATRLAAVERLFDAAPRVLLGVGPFFVAGFGALAFATHLLGDLASAEERQVVMRALPHNPTTEMDLALWSLAQKIGDDPAAAQTIRETPPADLARNYLTGTLPGVAQRELAAFLKRYGHRGVAEIDLGVPRWADDPTHLLGVIANYLHLTDPELAPDRQFRRAATAARAMIAGLSRRAGQRGRLRGALVGFALRRARALAGLREGPKYYVVLILAQVRALLLPVGEELVRAGRLDTDDDIVFLTLPEIYRALDGADQRTLVHARREERQRESSRRHIPRLLLSDGTEPTADPATTDGDLTGTPASAGTVTAPARVILDPTGAHLKTGEILVAPSTDPGWTPLFLTAGGLVMEMGGAMSHGAVVAREYGIPAVVGVAGATERIETGQRLTIDGAAGTIAFEELLT